MKTNQLTRLIAVTAIACLPMACGTSSPTAPDVTAFETSSTLSALRVDPTAPQAPEAPSPDPVPAPEVPVKDDPTAIEEPEAGTTPTTEEPTGRNGRRPGSGEGDPSSEPDPGADPNPDDDAGSIPTPDPTAIPAPDTGSPGRTPPAPPTIPQPVVCRAVSIEIEVLSTFAGTDGMALEAILMDKDGLAITDSSCEKVLWAMDGNETGANRLVFTYGASSRFVTVSGPAGPWAIAATTPNGQSTVLVVTLP